MAEDGINAGDVRRAAVFVAFVLDGEPSSRVQVAAEALATGRLGQLGRVLDVLWLGTVELPACMLDARHLRMVAARLALAEAQGRELPPPGWLRPAA